MQIYTVEEFIKLKIPRPRHGHKWGRWMLDAKSLTLQHFREGHWDYEVDLERCTDAPSILDWILQSARKSWTTPDDIGNLVLALSQLAGSAYGLQGKVCPAGYATSENTIDYKAILAIKGRKKS